MIARTFLRVAAAGALVAAAACDSGPSGPGSLTAFVDGSTVGGVVLEVSGRGILGFEGLSSTRVYASPVAGQPDTHRVMLVNPDSGELRFEIQVRDVGMEDPVIHVVSAAGLDNSSGLPGGVQVRIER